VNLLFLRLWQREERFEAFKDLILDLRRDTVTNDLEEAIVQTALANIIYELSFGCFISAVKHCLLLSVPTTLVIWSQKLTGEVKDRWCLGDGCHGFLVDGQV